MMPKQAKMIGPYWAQLMTVLPFFGHIRIVYIKLVTEKMPMGKSNFKLHTILCKWGWEKITTLPKFQVNYEAIEIES